MTPLWVVGAADLLRYLSILPDLRRGTGPATNVEHFRSSLFWLSERAGPKLSACSTFKPNLAQLGVVLAHAHIAGFVRPFETFFGQFPIISGRHCTNSMVILSSCGSSISS
jgi:hypothetical protein